MRFKQLLIAVSVCAVTMAPAISHAEDVWSYSFMVPVCS